MDKGEGNTKTISSLQARELAILPKQSDVYSDAQPALDPESVERFCQVWAGVGRAILARRSKQHE